MNSKEQQLSELIAKVANISPQLVDFWQATAIVESLGYTDDIILQEFDFPDALSLGKYIYEHHQSLPIVKVKKSKISFARRVYLELQIFFNQFIRSFVYAVPLIIILILGDTQIVSETKILPPQLASLFTIATLASLITSGGFVQMISRRGEFYLGLGEPLQAQRVCLSIFYIGSIVSIGFGLLGLFFGFYRSFFADEFLIIATIYYLMLSLLWMLLAVVSIQISWGTPIALLGFTTVFILLRFWLAIGALEAQILSMSIALAVVICSLVLQTKKNDRISDVRLPRLSATVYLLAPYFGYGITYFGFIFADRLVAGWAISPNSGLIFAINSNYQKAMDLALLNFLIVVPLIEYLSCKFILDWFSQAKKVSIKTQKNIQRLRDRYILAILITIIFFAVSISITVNIFKPLQPESLDLLQVSIGCLGYLFLTLGLFNAIVLFNLNQASTVLKILIPALILNLITGYLLANLIEVRFAAIGLLLGAILFTFHSSQKLLKAIAQFDYFYYLGGY
ncbi:MAG: hypothetical protein ACRC2R_20545 [Xenococcaceae cyanobacterium]